VATVEPEPDLLAPTPATGHLIGYARTSRRNQLLDRQISALTTAGCKRIYQDQLSGKDAARPGLTKALDHLLEGDTLMVTELSRLGRSLQDLITIVADLRRRNIGFRSLHEQLDTTTPGGRLVFHVFAALAEFIRELIAEGTSEGLDAARARGQRLGRPPVMTPDKIRMASELVGKESWPPSPDCSASTEPPSTPTSPRSKTGAAPPYPGPRRIGTISPANQA